MTDKIKEKYAGMIIKSGSQIPEAGTQNWSIKSGSVLFFLGILVEKMYVSCLHMEADGKKELFQRVNIACQYCRMTEEAEQIKRINPIEKMKAEYKNRK